MSGRMIPWRYRPWGFPRGASGWTGRPAGAGHLCALLLALGLLAALPAPGPAEDQLEVPEALDLKSCLFRAAQDNPSVLSGRDRVEEARSGVGSARADLLPDVDLADVHRKTERDFPATFSNPRYSHQITATLHQRVYSGGALQAAVRLSRGVLSEVEAAYLETLEKVLERVANAYLDVLEQGETQETLSDSIRTQQRRLEEINAKIEAGVMLETHRLQAELLVLEDERQLLVSRTAEQLARSTLGVLLGLGQGITPELDRDFSQLEGLGVERVLADLSTDRSPVLRRAEARVQQAEAQLGIARGNSRPQVDLAVTQYHIANGLSFISQDANYAEATGNLNFPLFDGGKRRAERRKATRGLDAARLEERALRDELTIEVGQAVLGIKENQARLRAAETRVELAQRNRDITQDRYLEGAAVQSEILDADVEWRRAKLERISSRFAVLRNLVKLLRVTGRLGRVALLGAEALQLSD